MYFELKHITMVTDLRCFVKSGSADGLAFCIKTIFLYFINNFCVHLHSSIMKVLLKLTNLKLHMYS